MDPTGPCSQGVCLHRILDALRSSACFCRRKCSGEASPVICPAIALKFLEVCRVAAGGISPERFDMSSLAIPQFKDDLYKALWVLRWLTSPILEPQRHPKKFQVFLQGNLGHRLGFLSSSFLCPLFSAMRARLFTSKWAATWLLLQHHWSPLACSSSQLLMLVSVLLMYAFSVSL